MLDADAVPKIGHGADLQISSTNLMPAFRAVFGSISFFVIIVDEICKLRAMTVFRDRIGIERYGIDDERLRRFRYGVQVNSLGLTENQPEKTRSASSGCSR